MTARKLEFFVAMVMAAFVMLPGSAKADLSITPVRVVFEGRDRSAIIELLNLTDHTNTYRMTWLHMKAKPEGGYETENMKTDDKDPHSVSNMVIFTPKQVTIEPHGHQVIRLSLRRPADLPFGEYRAHMALIRMASSLQETRDPNAKGIELAMNVNIGFSIPVIVRSGDDKDLKVSLQLPKLEVVRNKPSLKVDIHRDAGIFSTYGELKVMWQPAQGTEKQIGTLNNVALYPEIQERHVIIPLTDNPTSGTLKVVYVGKLESDGKTWAEKSFPIGK